MPHSGAPHAHRITVETEHLSGLLVRVDMQLDMFEVGFHDWHGVGQLQTLARRVSLVSIIVVVNESKIGP